MPCSFRSWKLTLETSLGKAADVLRSKDFEISDARRRNSAVEVSAGSGVVDFWVVRKEVSQDREGTSPLLLLSWAEIWFTVAGLQVAISMCTNPGPRVDSIPGVG